MSENPIPVEKVIRVCYDHTVEQLNGEKGGYAVFWDKTPSTRVRITPFFARYQGALDAEKARKFFKNPSLGRDFKHPAVENDIPRSVVYKPVSAEIPIPNRKIKKTKEPAYVEVQADPDDPSRPKCCPNCQGTKLVKNGTKWGRQCWKCTNTECGRLMQLPRFRGVDLTGFKSGLLTVLHPTENPAAGGHRIWLCQCECGNTVESRSTTIVNHQIKSCGCRGKTAEEKQQARDHQKAGMKARNTLYFQGRKKPKPAPKPQTEPKADRYDLVGRRFGHLVVLELAGRDNTRKRLWKCQCDCGRTNMVRSDQLLSKGTKSCGCQKRVLGLDAVRKKLRGHGGKFIRGLPAPAIVKRESLLHLSPSEEIEHHIRQGLIPPEDLLNMADKWKKNSSTSSVLGFWGRPTIILPNQRRVSGRVTMARSEIHGRTAGMVERPVTVAFPAGVLSGILDQSSMSRSRLRHSRDTFEPRVRLSLR